jgi:signal peptidase I
MDSPSKIRRILKGNYGLILFFIGLAFFRTAVADWNRIPSGSMEPTLYDGDWVWVDKIDYGPTVPFANIRLFGTRGPDRGDIITFVPPHTKELYVKRVVGIPGDIVRFDGRDIYINEKILAYERVRADYSAEIDRERLGDVVHLTQYSRGGQLPVSNGSFVVPEDRYFVLGDHRSNSADSRYWGLVEGEKIMGRVTHVAISFSGMRALSERLAIPVD